MGNFVIGLIDITFPGAGPELLEYLPPPPPAAALIIIPFPSIELLFPFIPSVLFFVSLLSLKTTRPPFPINIVYIPEGKLTSL
jgi:hypothetical protein